VPARLFTEFVAQLPAGKVDLSLKEDTLTTKIDHFNSQIKGLSADEFPLIPRIKEGKLFTVRAGDLKAAINMVSFSAALDETRPVLSGIYFKVEKNKLTMAATDSYRLSEKTLKVNSTSEEKKEAIIPARSLMEISRILDDPEKEVSVYLDETQVMFETEDLEFTSRLVEGKFPDYKNIIPESFETKAKMSLNEFGKIVKVAALFARESAGSVTIEAKKNGSLEVSAASSSYGDSTSSCEAEIEGKDNEVVFNSRYLIDALNNLNDGQLLLEISGKLSASVLKKEGDKSFIYVIMPLRA
jgi:DNA polymerase-3 subunit beta